MLLHAETLQRILTFFTIGISSCVNKLMPNNLLFTSDRSKFFFGWVLKTTCRRDSPSDYLIRLRDMSPAITINFFGDLTSIYMDVYIIISKMYLISQSFSGITSSNKEIVHTRLRVFFFFILTLSSRLYLNRY